MRSLGEFLASGVCFYDDACHLKKSIDKIVRIRNTERLESLKKNKIENRNLQREIGLGLDLDVFFNDLGLFLGL
ncbi:hypothetical protein BpHYR1_052055 [Brachionus plicatilis]|uniref:Uncharacterized protein n=1 Tax=Brachionus plicatilis TaxID=10195 RepID=A0A3M7QN02_BRAPC|nr:hypothetical protein BpHYR1_052055 [Brachionus plicatilis]